MEPRFQGRHQEWLSFKARLDTLLERKMQFGGEPTLEELTAWTDVAAALLVELVEWGRQDLPER